jgi:hypothetical protein
MVVLFLLTWNSVEFSSLINKVGIVLFSASFIFERHSYHSGEAIYKSNKSVCLIIDRVQENNKKWPRGGQHFTLRAEISGAAP